MLQLAPHQKLLLAIDTIDFRKGIDAIAAICRTTLQHDPFAGALFVFANKRRTAVKILVYDGTGFWLCLKRFSKGSLKWWPRCHEEANNITSRELHLMLHQGDPTCANFSKVWKKINTNNSSNI